MRLWLVLCLVVCAASSSLARAEDFPPPPPLELDDELPLDPGDALVDDAPALVPPPGEPPPPMPSTEDVGRKAPGPAEQAPAVGWGPAVGSAVGCLAGASVPLVVGALLGLSTGPACASVVCASATVGACVSGPLVGGGAAAGAGLGALVDGSDLLSSLGWVMPGLGIGLVGFGITAAGSGLLYASTSSSFTGPGDLALPIGLIVSGAALQLAAGPVSVLGVWLGGTLQDESAKAARPERRREQGLALPEPAPSLALAY